LYGPVFTDFIGLMQTLGFQKTFNFDRDMRTIYCNMFGHSYVDDTETEPALADCDSIFLGCVIDSNMKCPRCGGFAFVEHDDLGERIE
jgi:hypothetical protein